MVDFALLRAKNEVSKAAVEWWKSKRPLSYDEEAHLNNPLVNTTTEAEKKLALDVSIYIRVNRESGNK